ncbi:MAG: hypothetical protein RSF88_11710 [Lachnospiraceae bacterium]
MQKFKQVVQVVKLSFIEWILDIRQLFVLAVILCTSNYTVTSLVRMSRDKEVPLNIVEPFLASVNSIYVILILLFCWLILISDYPKMEGNNGYILIRISRKIWLFGKLAAIMLGAAFYILELIVVFFIRTASVSFFANGWSYLMKDYAEKYMEESTKYAIVCVVQENIWNHYLPYEAMGKTILLLFGLLCICGFIMMASSLSKSKITGLILNLILIVGGFAMVQTKSTMSCLLPVGNVMLSAQATHLIWLVPKWFSGVYFTVIGVGLLILNLILIKYGQVQKDGEQ